MQQSKLKTILLSGGVSEEEYQKAKPQIDASNFKTWRLSSVFFEILFLIIFVISLIFSSIPNVTEGIKDMFRSYMIPFGILSFYMVILVLIYLVIKSSSKAMLPLIYISMGVILASIGSIYVFMDAYLETDVSGAAFIATMVLLPFFVTDRPIRYCIFTFLAGATYIVLCFTIKDASIELKIRDLILGAAFTLASIFISIFTNMAHIKRCVDLYTMELQRDTDALTNVKNVNAYDRKVDELKKKIRSHNDLKFAIVVFDINDLKYINDSYGHSSGDELIVKTAKVICDSFKHSPVYRIGGDEFVTILEGSDYANREVLLRHLHEYLDEIQSSQNKKEVSMAMGVGIYNPKQDFDYVSVFSRADAEMYDNKRIIKAKLTQQKSQK